MYYKPFKGLEKRGNVMIVPFIKNGSQGHLRAPQSVNIKSTGVGDVKKEDMIVRFLCLSESFKGKFFESFDEVRIESNRIINTARNEWVNACLLRNGIILNSRVKYTKRELVDFFEKNNITITRETKNKKDVKEDFDVMRKDGKIIGKWNNKREIKFGERTEKLYAKVEYYIV